VDLPSELSEYVEDGADDGDIGAVQARAEFDVAAEAVRSEMGAADVAALVARSPPAS
jgi:hypothetical protein